MFRIALFCSLLTGTFPYAISNSGVKVSKFGLFANLCSFVFIVYQVVLLGQMFVKEIQNQSPSTNIRFIIQITNALFLSAILIRRFIGIKIEVQILSKFFEHCRPIDKCWCKSFESVVVFLVELCEIAVEFVIFVGIQISQNGKISLYDLTLLVKLGFEMQIVVILIVEQRFYKYLNTLILFNGVQNSVVIYNLRCKFENLHVVRALINELYGLDLLLYFLSAQLSLLLECFESVGSFSGEDSLKMIKIVLGGLRFIRLFVIIIYIIWRWCAVSDECWKTAEYIFDCHQKIIIHQLDLFLEDIYIKNKLFVAHKFYDIDMKLLYNICGTIFAYLILIITSSSSMNQQVLGFR